ncbi:MAG: hypothetical protein AABW92_01165 [Nanoarchaeota archaeon]
MLKKAEISLQFNWIYIIVVGSIILISGFAVVSNIKKTSINELILDLKLYLDTIINDIQLDKESEHTVMLPDIEIEFECNSFSIKDSEYSSISLLDNILFSPNIIKRTLLGYSLHWNIPFTTEFFSYITSPNVKYAFLDSEHSRTLMDILPNNTNKELAAQYKDYNEEKNYKVRYINFGNLPQDFSFGDFRYIDDGDVSILKINIIENEDSFPDSIGKITYYKKEDNSLRNIGEINFLDKATLMASIYSEIPEIYNCNLEKSFKKLNIMATIKMDKLTEYSNNPHLSSCPYEQAIDNLNNMILLTSNVKTDQNYVTQVYDLSKSIEKENKLLQRLSCPQIY